jgi:hypothetical protein
LEPPLNIKITRTDPFGDISNVAFGNSNEGGISAFNQLIKKHDSESIKRPILGIGCESILNIADTLKDEVLSLDEDLRIVIDLTSLSHELLCVLVAILKQANRLENSTLCYTGAGKYSHNTKPDEMWLSRGVHSIRSILGFPGEMLPSKPLHLVLMMGFEVERALEVIVRYEPDALSLGMGDREQSVSEVHFNNNLVFFNKLNDFIKEQELVNSELKKFDFSCVDPFKTKEALEKHLSEYHAWNTVICPLNTKLSTVGAALLCFDKPEYQLCYSQPIEYNISGYASAGEYITVVEL